MANEPSPERRDRSGAPPWEVEITVLPGPPAPALRERLARLRTGRARTAAALALTAAALAAIAVLMGGGASPSPAGRADAQARRHGPLGVAAAYGYPAECLTISFAPADPAYARADFNHRPPCGRFDGDAAAVFHRVHGAWRAVFVEAAYTCPVAALPRRIQAQLGVCAVLR